MGRLDEIVEEMLGESNNLMDLSKLLKSYNGEVSDLLLDLRKVIDAKAKNNSDRNMDAWYRFVSRELDAAMIAIDRLGPADPYKNSYVL